MYKNEHKTILIMILLLHSLFLNNGADDFNIYNLLNLGHIL